MNNFEESNNHFAAADVFDEFESANKVKVPLHLKNLIISNGFDNEILLKDISESDIIAIDKYAQTILHKNIAESEYKNFFGPMYCHQPSKFDIVLGHKKLIWLMKSFFAKKYKNTEEKGTMAETTNRHARDKGKTEKCSSASQSSLISATSQGTLRDIHVLNTDLTQENKHIFSTIRSWVETKCDQTKLGQINLNNLKICASVSQSNNNEDMICLITCFCGAVIKIIKSSKTAGLKSRWICTNYYTHFIRKHLDSDKRSTSSKRISDMSSDKSLKKSSKKMCSYSIKEYMISNKIAGEVSTSTDHESSEISAEIASDQLPCRSQETAFIKRTESSQSKIKILHSVHFQDFIPVTSTDLSFTNSSSISEKSASSHLEHGAQSMDIDKYEAGTDIMDSDSIIDKNLENIQTSDLGKEYTSKWASCKYGREERNRRQRERFHNNQLLLTNFFPVLQKINSVIDDSSASNPNRVNVLNDTINNIKLSNTDLSTGESITRNKFLETLIHISCTNKDRFNNRNLYDDDFKKFCLYLFYCGGKLLDETLHSNLNNILPSLPTLYRFRSGLNIRIQEGQFNFKGLHTFLEERNLPKVVWISEDGTRITGKIEYDPITNKIAGFVLPLEEGIPNNNAYVATTAEVIENYFRIAEKADYAYCIMAQPLDRNSPAFCLAVFGTNNKFTNSDVSMRWNRMISEASLFGIKILGFSSDGDTRLLKAMKNEAGFPFLPDDEQRWFHLDNDNVPYAEISFIQDQTHVLTKLRTRFLKFGIKLPMGNFEATVEHLNKLIENNTKDQHLLTKSDVSLEDKMNYESAKKMCSNRVQQLLNEVEASSATRIYLKVMDYLIASFIKKDETLYNRIYKIWYATFVLRIWRQWIKQQPKYSLQENFITLNCYVCIELNAHALINLVKLFKERDDLNTSMFCPWLFSSQPCEGLFRSARSITSTFSTVVNFSIKDFLSRIDRITFINYVINDLKNIYIFPRETKRQKEEPWSTTEEDIKDINVDEVVLTAMQDALEDSKNLGMHVHERYCNTLNMQENKIGTRNISNKEHCDTELDCEIDSELDGEHVKESINEDLIVDKSNILQSQFMENDIVLEGQDERQDVERSKKELQNECYLDLKDYSNKNVNVTEDSPFLKIELPNRKTAIIKKSSFCWLLCDSKGKVSPDRLRRFIVSKSKVTKKASSAKKGSTQKIRITRKSHSTKKAKIKDFEGYSERESSEESESDVVSYDDSTDTEIFTGDCLQMQDEDSQQKQSFITNIVNETYYAVRYEEGWFIGRVLEKLEGDKYKMKFLKQELDSYIWPKNTDIQYVEQTYIFLDP